MNGQTAHAADPSALVERTPWHANGLAVLISNIVLLIASTALLVVCLIRLEQSGTTAMLVAGITASLVYLSLINPLLLAGLKILKPNEALVLTLFGKYHGTLKQAGFYYVIPFVSTVSPAGGKDQAGGGISDKQASAGKGSSASIVGQSAPKTISLKAMTLNNEKQKINDVLGNPIIIGIVVIWKVVNTAKAAFNVDNYMEYLSIQCDSALRNTVRLYPYDSPDEVQEKSLRGSSQDVALHLQEEIQQKVEIAGLEVLEARITHLSYAPEIAAAMLQRQQASAIIAARQMIVEGAVGMVEMALARLSEKQIVQLDEERKAAMVSNLLVVLCASKDAQPIVNSGSIY